LISAVNNSQVYLINPLSYINTTIVFKASALVATGNYYVRIRNIFGESNSLGLLIKWNTGIISTAYGSTTGNVVTFSGGSGFPTSLSDANFVRITNPTTNLGLDVNVIACCINNSATITVPPVSNGTQLLISFVTPSQVYSTSYSVNSYYTPLLLLISNSVMSTGLNTVIIQRNDTLNI
jgi:hypothetical protein